jgi:Na+/melibiose symporter-like transporter
MVEDKPNMAEDTPKPLSLGVMLSYALPRLAMSLFSQHVSGKTRKYYTDGEPGMSPATIAMVVSVLKCADLFIGMMVGLRRGAVLSFSTVIDGHP